MTISTQHERFCHLLLIGKSNVDAYIEVFGLKPHETASHPNVHARANALARDKMLQARLDTLRAPVIRELQHTFKFNTDLAMEKAEHAHDLAELMMDPGNMLKAIELQSKLRKLLVNVSEVRRDVLDEQSTEDLVQLLSELRTRRDADVVIDSLPGPHEACDEVYDAGSGTVEAESAARRAQELSDLL